MPSIFSKLKPRSLADKTQAAETIGRAKSVNEFLGDVVTAVKDTNLPEAVSAAVPWLEPLGVSLSEAVPPVRFVVKLFEEATRIDDPDDLGYLACTLAYQQAVQQAVPEVLGEEAPPKKEVETKLREETPPEEYDFEKFSYADALNHPFIADADRYLERFVHELGYNEAAFRQLQHQVHVRFVPNLKVLLSHGKTRERFAPFTDLLKLRTDEARAYDALLRHADHQRWLYEERPVLGREPFALQHIYVETDCGKLTWGEIDAGRRPGGAGEGERVDPFDEEHGGRVPLVETALDLIADPDFDDAIVIQGLAGSGKSSFTLRFCDALLRQGLRPIRIELKNLDARETRSIDEALPEAVQLSSPERDSEAERFSDNSLFLDGKIFKEYVSFRRHKICPYILILDGWDEISLGASAGYQEQVKRLLCDIRETYLERRLFPVRVILAGRPSNAVAGSRFLRRDTQILTVRPLTPQQLEKLVENTRVALTKHPFSGRTDAESWDLDKVAGLDRVIERYGADFNRAKANARLSAKDKAKKLQESGRDETGSLEVLGLPLLALLALRLLAEWPGSDIRPLVENTTTLYRSLVDLVIGKGGKPDVDDFEPEGRPTLTGSDLRALLRNTAEAMTVLGSENISREELAVRLDLESQELDERIKEFGEDRLLTRLMISFFFKGGHRELGCEFSHKSFREYLFAEQIVETLKDYGRVEREPLPERPTEAYWKDFPECDPRWALSRSLAEKLGPVWVTLEVGRHLTELLRWEIARAVGKDPYPKVGQQTAACDLKAWERIRDALADLWDWWGEGVHIRPQPRRKPKSREVEYLDPLALEVARGVRYGAHPDKVFPPLRLVTIDAHLGDALCRLAAEVHGQINLEQKWPGSYGLELNSSIVDELEADSGQGVFLKRLRRCQTRVRSRRGEWLLFRPAGSLSSYLKNYIARINAAGFRPEGPFPSFMRFIATDLNNAILCREDLRGVDLFGAICFGADLSYADLSDADLTGAFFSKANFSSADLSVARLAGSNFDSAYLSDAYLGLADCSDVSFRGAKLFRVDFSSANLSDADFSCAEIGGAKFSGALLDDARLSYVDMSDADFAGAFLDDADFY